MEKGRFLVKNLCIIFLAIIIIDVWLNLFMCDYFSEEIYKKSNQGENLI